MTNVLWITAIGMGLVFAAILLLWGLMALLVRVTEPRPSAAVPAVVEAIPAALTEAETDAELRRKRAAAAAVAVALALRAAPPRAAQRTPEAAAAGVATWQAVQRAQELSRRGLRNR